MRGLERERFLLWERLSPTQKHMILMYFYRVETELMEEMDKFIETYYFHKCGIQRSQLPMAVTALRGIALKKAAYAVIGKTLPMESEDEHKRA